ncbi:recombination-associated protein RdgC, partial [uncultured Pseudacidovorax sp.]|uniref:recombination-associated protein RdgC n=1 Tax=uncultured Pseudacidovorax sp. TaxID=679313 RepID=UPI0026008521
TEGMQLRKLQFLEGVFDGAGSDAQAKDEGFDTDAAIVTGELGQLLPALLEALGGEMKPGMAAAAAAPLAAPRAEAQAATAAAADDDGPPF